MGIAALDFAKTTIDWEVLPHDQAFLLGCSISSFDWADRNLKPANLILVYSTLCTHWPKSLKLEKLKASRKFYGTPFAVVWTKSWQPAIPFSLARIIEDCWQILVIVVNDRVKDCVGISIDINFVTITMLFHAITTCNILKYLYNMVIDDW